MNALQIIKVVRDQIKTLSIYATIDPYESFENVLGKNKPLVLIETGEGTDFKNNSAGKPCEMNHEISVTCMVNTTSKEYEKYKEEAFVVAKSIIDTITGNCGNGFLLFSKNQKDGEFNIGSIKVSAVTINLSVTTNYKD